jgi:hypothetical protein
MFGILIMESSAGILNDGDITLGVKGALAFNGLAPIEGGGVLRLAHPSAVVRTDPMSPRAQIINRSTIAGSGRLQGALVNEHVIRADTPGGDLRLLSSSTLVNDGVFSAVDGGVMRLLGVSVSGVGLYVIDGGDMILESIPKPALTSVNGASASVRQGALSIGPGATLSLTGALLLQDGGLLTGAMDMPTVAAGEDGSFSSESVTVECDAGMALGGKMSASADEDFVLDGTGSKFAQFVGGCAPPGFETTGDASVEVGGDFTMVESVNVTYRSSVPMRLAGDFKNLTLDSGSESAAAGAADFDWIDGGILIDGGVPLDGGNPQSFEAAGEDRGANLSGYQTNFEVGLIEIASTSTVTLEDAFDNDDAGQAPCTEALYVYNLGLASGASLTLDDCRIYYAHLVDDGGRITPIGCGAAILIPTGDADGDRDIDLLDASSFHDCLTGPNAGPVPPQCATFDHDQDNDIDFSDFAPLQRAYNQPLP